MPLPRFTFYTAVGSAIWNGVLIGAGWALGERWEEASRYTKFFEYAVIALLVFFIWRFIWRCWRGKSAAPETRRGIARGESTGGSS